MKKETLLTIRMATESHNEEANTTLFQQQCVVMDPTNPYVEVRTEHINKKYPDVQTVLSAIAGSMQRILHDIATASKVKEGDITHSFITLLQQVQQER